MLNHFHRDYKKLLIINNKEFINYYKQIHKHPFNHYNKIIKKIINLFKINLNNKEKIQIILLQKININ